MKFRFSFLFILLSMSVLSQNINIQTVRARGLSIKVYGGISPLLSDKVEVRIPSLFTNFNYEDDPGYNAGVNVGYFLTNNIALQVGFEKKENRIFLTNYPGPQGFSSRLSTKLNSNILYISSNYHFISQSNFDPYFGVGAALIQDANYEFVISDFNGSGEIGLRGLVGVNYNFNSKFALNFEMNYTAFNDIEVEDREATPIFDIEYNPLTFNLGFVYTLNLFKGNK